MVRLDIGGIEAFLHRANTPEERAIIQHSLHVGDRIQAEIMLEGTDPERAGALRAELEYFARCAAEGRRPEIITPVESLRAVEACLAAERSAATGEVVRL